MISWYPVREVLNTTSPTTVPVAPKERPSKTVPSESTRRQSFLVQGLSGPALAATKRRDAPGDRELPKKAVCVQ